ncbi:hypothetical protein A2767_06830 [Candidatus Roizmanbacteria bacterium RIFCSPHIGHO2_01_FULL_35_10]|uniref:Glycosyltransferase RgtA/B/C/D-like domain-containing protein n=1 Tax=Candidatus Roizmanbacteria bacterium RIFCSPLOWO2_01_FULL_35_13 TaxID=1802055 RepID=A0A1F7I7K5_9BACT|nr:MAG: hypothetical protein A2767_06830 [Candidatus Roizmanbacteria bacterium RIFCSPHIGHO2_01_FULL_35_10]OGK39346.1 MAG: hypothetical protein A3A74_05245 [Candidatus Roizmanbacteria bacterium RIFCSPLOWO2_01_FULL_35_13]
MKNKITFLILTACILIPIFLHFYKINEIPPCINADEAAFGYNAYSILKTGRDEYGSFMPLRFKSFEDYKLPIYTYLSVPFMAIFGLNDFSTRVLNILIGISFVPLMYFLAKELFSKEKVSLLSAFLTSLSPGIYILTRHAHEGVIGTFFILLSLLFLVKYLKSQKLQYFIFLNIFLLLNAFSYQTGRIYLLFFFILQLIILYYEKKLKESKIAIKVLVLLFIVTFSLFFDFKYGLNRVNNLLFLKNAGFNLRIIEYLGEHPNRIIHNKLTEALRDVSNRYVSQFSPEYLVINGDSNLRFGFPNLGLFTFIEYLFIFIGFYFLFKNKERFRYMLVFLILITPISNALTWQGQSLIRTYTLLFPIILVIAYGFYNCLNSINNKSVRQLFAIFCIGLFIFFKYYSFDTYFNHYPKRATTIRAWQCGYKELVDYVKQNYDKYDRFYITDRHGQPYIYFLYYWPFDPAAYQKQAKISAPDQYGFGQVGKFDKFDFNFQLNPILKKSAFIGYPEHFNNADQEVLNKIKKIKFGTEEIFWIYEAN